MAWVSAGQHGGLVDDADAGQVLFYVEAFAVLSIEGGVKGVGGQGTFYIFSQYLCLFHVFYYDRWCSCCCMGECGSCFLVSRFAMNDDGIIFLGDLCAAVPDFFNKRTGCIVFFCLDADGPQSFFDLERCAKSRYDHDVVFGQVFEGYELLSMGVLEELNAAGQEVGVDLGVVDHFAEQEDAFAGVFVDGAEGDLDGVFDAVAEAEVAGEVDVRPPRSRRVGVKSFFILSCCRRLFLMAEISGLR